MPDKKKMVIAPKRMVIGEIIINLAKEVNKNRYRKDCSAFSLDDLEDRMVEYAKQKCKEQRYECGANCRRHAQKEDIKWFWEQIEAIENAIEPQFD